MADTNKRGEKKRPRPDAPREGDTTDHPTEEEPAVERGERIDTGKTIARGGKETGHVPGATGRPAERRDDNPHR